MPIPENTENFVSRARAGLAEWIVSRRLAPANHSARPSLPQRTSRLARFSCFLLLSCLLGSIVVSIPGVAQDKPAKSLYERVGRYDGISAIAEAYLAGVRSDPQFARFVGRGADSLTRAKQLLKDQLCALTGGPCTYIGRDMKTAHGGLGITAAEWATNMKYLAAALDKQKITGPEKAEFLALVDSLQPAIVEKP